MTSRFAGAAEPRLPGVAGDRTLSPSELDELVRRVAGDPEAWRGSVRHDAGRRYFAQIHLDEHVGIWLICWMDGHDTGFHDHDISSGAFTVVQGRLREERPRFDAPASAVALEPGGSANFGPADIHRVVHEGDAPAVSIHAYSPPLMRMGSYAIGQDGAVLRMPMGPVEELRPLATV